MTKATSVSSKLSSWFSALRLLVETETTFASVNIISAFLQHYLSQVRKYYHHMIISVAEIEPLHFTKLLKCHMHMWFQWKSISHIFPVVNYINRASSSNISEHSFLAFMWKGSYIPPSSTELQSCHHHHVPNSFHHAVSAPPKLHCKQESSYINYIFISNLHWVWEL